MIAITRTQIFSLIPPWQQVMHITMRECAYSWHIKTSGSELQGQEEAACMRISGLHDHYSELFTWIAALKL